VPPRPGEGLGEDLPRRIDAIAGFPADGPVEVRGHVAYQYPWTEEKASERGGKIRLLSPDGNVRTWINTPK
jgi:hypothetical protein